MSNLVQEALEVCRAIEGCGASVELTNAVSKASALYHKLNNRRDFGWAIEQLKAGNKMARAGWNGKGMWLGYVGARKYDVYEASIKPEYREGEIGFLPWIGMKTADNKFVPWLASQTDVLAEDWCVV